MKSKELKKLEQDLKNAQELIESINEKITIQKFTEAFNKNLKTVKVCLITEMNEFEIEIDSKIHEKIFNLCIESIKQGE